MTRVGLRNFITLGKFSIFFYFLHMVPDWLFDLEVKIRSENWTFSQCLSVNPVLVSWSFLWMFRHRWIVQELQANVNFFFLLLFLTSLNGSLIFWTWVSSAEVEGHLQTIDDHWIEHDLRKPAWKIEAFPWKFSPVTGKINEMSTTRKHLVNRLLWTQCWQPMPRNLKCYIYN